MLINIISELIDLSGEIVRDEYSHYVRECFIIAPGIESHCES